MTLQIILVCINIMMAGWHSELIHKNKPIYHGLWTAIYFVLTLILIWIFSFNFVYGLGFSILIRALIFDIFLNLFRGLPVTYQSSSTTSIYDMLIRKIDFWPLRLIYLILIIGLNLLMWIG